MGLEIQGQDESGGMRGCLRIQGYKTPLGMAFTSKGVSDGYANTVLLASLPLRLLLALVSTGLDLSPKEPCGLDLAKRPE